MATIGASSPVLASAAPPDWPSAARAVAGRDGHTATLLPNGTVLVAGGGGVASAERYDPATNTWSSAATMSIPRLDHTATLLPNGRLLVAGGSGPGSEYYGLASAELYDPVTDSWSSARDMAEGRYAGHTATLLPSGEVLVVGGMENNFLAGAELYAPATDSWSSAGVMAARGHFAHTATLLPSGKVLVAGGAGGGRPYWTLASADLYDPGTHSWSPAASMATARSGHTATLLDNGEVLVTGGGTGSVAGASAELYDPGTDRWSAAASMATARTGHTATLLPNGTVLVAGGGVASAELYDPATDSWSAAATMATVRTGHTATLLHGGQVLVAGGDEAGSAELYDPATNSWSSAGSLTTPPYTYTFVVRRTGSGSGRVTSSLPGIDCGSACSAQFRRGEQVTLSATPDSGSTFAGWSGGGCHGSATCTLTMAGDQVATARFASRRPTCTVSSTGKVRARALAIHLACDQTAQVRLRATLTDKRTITVHRHRKTKTTRYRLAAVAATARAGRTVVVKLRLPASAVADLMRGAKQSVAVRLTATSASGTSRMTSTISRLTAQGRHRLESLG